MASEQGGGAADGGAAGSGAAGSGEGADGGAGGRAAGPGADAGADAAGGAVEGAAGGAVEGAAGVGGGAAEGADAGAEGGALDQPLVWVDLEMTGLDPERDVIVEAAVIITDGSLDRVVEGPDLVIHQPDEALDAMVQVVADMHGRSGLTEAVRASKVTVADAAQAVLEFVTAHVPEARSAPLAGNSVHADRAFLRRYMPEVEAHLHYRNVDVSTVKELARRWRPELVAGAPEKGGGHRALADIRESIEELRYYRDALCARRGGQESS